MPEIRELLTHYLHLLWVLLFLLLPTGENKVVALWFDSDSGKNEPTDSWHARGLVGHLVPQADKDLPKRMGASLWPEHLTEDRVQTLRLTDLEWNSRLLLFKFEEPDGAETWMSARFYTHTSVQAYNHEQWHESVSLTKKALRGFRIAFAIEFAKYTISFNSQDRLCQIQWAKSRDELPGGSWPNILDDWRGFLTAIVTWRRCSIQKQSHEKRKQNLIIDVIKDIPFSGIGVYTGSDVLHGAGIPPYISESAVFDNPPVLARFLESLYHFVRRYHDSLYEEYVKPCIHDGVLAPNRGQRLNYARCISVHGKDTVHVTKRQKDAIEAYMRSKDPEFHFFEPAKIRHYLWEPGHLGHLIFAGHHSTVAPIGWTRDSTPDPITAEFFPHTVLSSRSVHDEEGVLCAKKPVQRYIDEWFTKSVPQRQGQQKLRVTTEPRPHARSPERSLDTFRTYLDLSLYTSHDATFNVKASKYSKVYAGRRNRKNFWTVIPVPRDLLTPKKVQGKLQDAAMKQYTQTEQGKRLFRHLIKNTRIFAIGPLEYCGSGIPVRPLKGEGKGTIILTTRFDPLPSGSLVARALYQRDHGHPKWDLLLTESRAIHSRLEQQHIRETKTYMLAAVKLIEDRVVFRLRLRQLAAIARIRNREAAERLRRAEEEKQFRKEEAYRVARHRQFMTYFICERGTVRSSRRRLLHDTWHLRRLHFAAWPRMYEKPLGPAPPVPANEQRRVRRSPISTWQNDLIILGYPSIVDEPPASLTTITSLAPRESSSEPAGHAGTEPSMDTFIAPYVESDGQTTLKKFYVVHRRDREYWVVFRRTKNPFRKDKDSSSESGAIKRPLRYHRGVYANALATALYRKTPFPTAVITSLDAYAPTPNPATPITQTAGVATSSRESPLLPAAIPIAASQEKTQSASQNTEKKRKNRNADMTVMGGVVLEGKRVRKAPQCRS